MEKRPPFKVARFYWDDDTLKYFNDIWQKDPHLCIESIQEFTYLNCELEEGETYQQLANDLIIQTIKF